MFRVRVTKRDRLIADCEIWTRPGEFGAEAVLGSDLSCDVVIGEISVAPRHAVLERRGWHTFVTPIEGAPVHAFGDRVPPRTTWRVDEHPFQLGDCVARVVEI